MLELIDGTIYSPKNYEPEFRGDLTLRNALRTSVNTVAVKLGIEVGLETVSQTARQMGIRTPVRPFYATAIGAESVYPIQLAEAYTVFANNGTRVRPRPILKVESADGLVLWEPPVESEAVFDPAVVAILRDMLRTALDNGSGNPARNPSWGQGLPYDIPAAGKTGTTNDATDIWFAGFTPDLLAIFWYGFDLPKKIPVTNAAGGVWVSPVWGNFMHTLYYGETPEFQKPAPWPIPEGITYRVVDDKTGLLASSFCPPTQAYTEMFLAGTEPTELCRNEDEGLFGGPLRGRVRTDTLPTDTGTIRRRRILH
jgi:penicillin-binding protein 1A